MVCVLLDSVAVGAEHLIQMRIVEDMQKPSPTTERKRVTTTSAAFVVELQRSLVRKPAKGAAVAEESVDFSFEFFVRATWNAAFLALASVNSLPYSFALATALPTFAVRLNVSNTASSTGFHADKTAWKV